MSKGLFAHSMHVTFGLFLVILGLFLFARQVGWVGVDFPVWPVVLVGFGVVIIAGELSKK